MGSVVSLLTYYRVRSLTYLLISSKLTYLLLTGIGFDSLLVLGQGSVFCWIPQPLGLP